MPISKEQQDNLEIWIKESDFDIEIEDELTTLIGFITDLEKAETTTGMTHEVLADFVDWCKKNLSYDAWSIEAIVHDYLGVPYGMKLRYWE